MGWHAGHDRGPRWQSDPTRAVPDRHLIGLLRSDAGNCIVARDDLAAMNGWGTVVHAGEPPPGVHTLADFATPGLARAIDLHLPSTGHPRAATIMSLHTAMSIIVRTTVAVYAIEGRHVRAAPDQLGVVPSPHGAGPVFWIGESQIEPAAGASAVGGTVGALLLPVIDAVCRRGRFGRRGVELVALDQLTDRVHRLSRLASGRGESWGDTLVDATGLRSDQPARHLVASVDAGPPVEFAVPRVCCVLSSTLSEGACPTCPKFVDDAARVRAIREWVDALDDDEFVEVTGRRRIGASPRLR